MVAPSPQLYTRSFDAPDQAFPVGSHARVEIVNLGPDQVHRATFLPGFRWSEHVSPIVGTDLCQIPHNGYAISGRLGVRMEDGTEREVAPGDVFSIPPVGHDIWVIGAEPALLIDYPPSGGHEQQ